jgi:hypothetical protein
MCIIDLLHKSDHVSIAKEFCKKMHTQPQNLVLAHIVSAYGSHCTDSIMDLVLEELLNRDLQNSGNCVLISILLSCLGQSSLVSGQSSSVTVRTFIIIIPYPKVRCLD